MIKHFESVKNTPYGFKTGHKFGQQTRQSSCKMLHVEIYLGLRRENVGTAKSTITTSSAWQDSHNTTLQITPNCILSNKL